MKFSWKLLIGDTTQNPMKTNIVDVRLIIGEISILSKYLKYLKTL